VKSPKTVALLLLLNLGLFAGILFYVLRARLASPIGANDSGPPGQQAGAATSAKAPPMVVEKVVVITNELRWAQLESEDYKTYVARLRAIGCPEQTIRDIIIADLDKLLAPELAVAYGRRQDLKYWHPEEAELLNDVDPHLIFQKEREIDKRKREIIRELIDADLSRERMRAQGREDYYERRLNFLPEARRTEVRELLEKFDEAEQKIREQETAESGLLSARQRTELRDLRQKREKEISSLLMPPEKELYDLWLSPTANEVRHALYGMEATEQEFLIIYEARKAFAETWGKREPDLLDSATRLEMEQAKSEMEARIQKGIGEQRYAEFKRGEDDDFHLLSTLVTRFKLPREKAGEVYGYKRLALDYREQVRNDPNLTPEQKGEALNALGQETANAVRQVLGAKAFNHYLRSGQGEWISH
jgi:hypothetical protein